MGCGTLLGAIFLIAIIVSIFSIGKGDNGSSPATDPFLELENSQASDISPSGELAQIFSYGSDFTNLQRENKLRELKGSVISWSLPVYEVRKRYGEIYRIQTDSTFKGELFGERVVSTFIDITARNDGDRAFIANLKTGDMVSFKGVIDDISMRSLEIKPAILLRESSPEEAKLKVDAVIVQVDPKRKEKFSKVASPFTPYADTLLTSGVPIYLPVEWTSETFHDGVPDPLDLYIVNNESFKVEATDNGYSIPVASEPECVSQYCLIGFISAKRDSKLVSVGASTVKLFGGVEAVSAPGVEKQPSYVVFKIGDVSYTFEFGDGLSKRIANLALKNGPI